MFDLSRKIRFGGLFFFITMLLGCVNDKNINSFEINGDFSNSNNEWVVAYKLSPTNITKLDSVMLDDDGKFSMHLSTSHSPELILLKIKQYPERITLVAENEDVISIKGDALYLNKSYSAKGNKSTEALRHLAKSLNMAVNDADSIYLSYRNSVNDSNSVFLKNQTDSLLKDNHLKAYEFVRSFCLENKNNLAGIIGLYSRYGENQILDYDIDFDVFAAVSESINKQFPNNEHALSLKEFVDEKYQKIAHAEEIEKSLEAGHKAPDIIRPNPEGKEIELTSFQGKYLILAFWSSTEKASWDMNAGLKEIAKEYKNKKVALLSVSTDIDKLQWVNTIAIDHLKWNHVLSNDAIENAYNLKGKSRLFLLDTQGIIMAKDISTDSLRVLLNHEIN